MKNGIVYSAIAVALAARLAAEPADPKPLVPGSIDLAALIGSTNALRVSSSDWEESRQRLRLRTDQWLERLESGRLESFAIRLVDDMLFTQAGVLAQGRGWEIDAALPPAEERQRYARQVLEPERYERLARALGGYAVGDSPPSHERDLAAAFLGRALAYRPLAGLLRRELELPDEAWDGADAKRRRAALAIALLYLDAPPPARAAAAALLADRTLPSPWRRDAFSALYRTGSPEQRNEAVRLGVEADDALVLHEMLDTQRARTDPPEELRGAMISWHERVVTEVEEGGKLTRSQEGVYMRLTTRLLMLGRSGSILSAEERHGLAAQCRRMLAAGTSNLRYSATGLLGAVGDEADDGEHLVALLRDSQSNVRSEAALALGRSFPQTRGKNLAKLVGMLGDSEEQVRANALYALWREHEPGKAHNMFFMTGTFEEQKAATLAWLKEHRGIEPAQAGAKGADDAPAR